MPVDKYPQNERVVDQKNNYSKLEFYLYTLTYALYVESDKYETQQEYNHYDNCRRYTFIYFYGKILAEDLEGSIAYRQCSPPTSKSSTLTPGQEGNNTNILAHFNFSNAFLGGGIGG